MNRLLIQFLIIAVMFNLTLRQPQAQQPRHESLTRRTSARNKQAGQKLIDAGYKAYEDADYVKALRLFQKAIEERPTWYEARYSTALCLYKMSRYNEALKQFRQALSLYHVHTVGSLGVLTHSSNIYRSPNKNTKNTMVLTQAQRNTYLTLKSSSGDWLGVLMANGSTGWVSKKLVRRMNLEVVSASPSADGIYKYIGDCFYRLKQMNEAITAYQKAVRATPNDIEAYRSLGETYSDLSKHLLSVDAFLQAGKLEPEGFFDRGENFSRAGQEYEFAERYAKAIEAYGLALKQDSKRNDHCDIAFCYLKLGDKDNAEKELLEGEKASTEKARYWYDFGDSLYSDQKYNDTFDKPLLEHALKSCEKSIQLDAGTKYYAIRSYFLMANIYLKLGQKEQAAESCKKPSTLELKGSDKELGATYSYLALEYALHKMPDEEEEACKQSLRYTPDDADAHASLAGLYDKSKHLAEAIEEYELSYKLKPEFYTGYLLGLEYMSAGKIENATQVYEKVSARFPNHYDICFSLGDAYDALDRKQKAAVARKRPLSFKLQSDYDYDGLYGEYVKLGWNDEALEACRKGILAFPKSTSLHYHLGLAYLKAGNRELALKQYSLLKTLDAEYAKLLFDAIYP